MHDVVFMRLFFIGRLEWHIVKTNGRQSGVSGCTFSCQLGCCAMKFIYMLCCWLAATDVMFLCTILSIISGIFKSFCTDIAEIACVGYYLAVQGHSRTLIFVLIESPFATSF